MLTFDVEVQVDERVACVFCDEPITVSPMLYGGGQLHPVCYAALGEELHGGENGREDWYPDHDVGGES